MLLLHKPQNQVVSLHLTTMVYLGLSSNNLYIRRLFHSSQILYKNASTDWYVTVQIQDNTISIGTLTLVKLPVRTLLRTTMRIANIAYRILISSNRNKFQFPAHRVRSYTKKTLVQNKHGSENNRIILSPPARHSGERTPFSTDKCGHRIPN